MTTQETPYNTRNIHEESEDIFAESKDVSLAPLATRKPANQERDAALALTKLIKKEQGNEDSEDDEDEIEEAEGTTFDIPERYTKSGRKKAVPFPLKLMKVLSMKQFNDLIAWSTSGESFNVLKPKAFTSDVLPKYFKSAKYSSFTRKLHRWGFMRHYRGEEAGCFFHPKFRRDRLDLVDTMTCYKPHTGPMGSQAKPNQALAMPPKNRMPVMLDQDLAMSPQHRQLLQQRLLLRAEERQQRQQMLPQMPQLVQMDAMPLSAHCTGGNNMSRASLRSDFSAAIELEVARRFQDRISAASLSRSALHLMQQQIKVSKAQEARQSLLLMQAQQRNMQQQQLLHPLQQESSVSWGRSFAAGYPGATTSSHLRMPTMEQSLLQRLKYQDALQRSQFQSLGPDFRNNASGMPQLNFPGAKTA